MGHRIGALLVVLAVGCSSSSEDAPATTSDAGPDSAASEDTGAPVDIRNTRYCEILLGSLSGETMHILVYNTQGLGECPQEEWAKLDAAAIKAENGSTVALLNGPRYWMINSLQGSKLADTTVKSFGAIPMRLAATIDIPVADLTAMQKPYAIQTINRDSQFLFSSGKSVFEIVAADGHVYTMQSYSLQKQAQTESTLPTLGSSLTLPSGWTFRTRTLTADLVLKAVDGKAHVLRDDYENTYLQSQ